MIFQTAEEIKDRETGEIADKIQPFWKARKTQAETNTHFANQSLKADVDALNRYNDAIRMVIEAKAEYGENSAEHIAALQRQDAAMKDSSETAKRMSKDFTDSYEKNEATIASFDKKQQDRIAEEEKRARSFKGFSTSMKAMGLNLGIDLLAGLLINGLVTGISALNDKHKWTASAKIEAMETAVNDYNSALSKSKDNISTIQSMQTEFAVLSQGVNDSGKNIGLSADEFDRYNQIVSELTSMNPELVKGYTAEGNAIVNRNSAIQDAIKLQQEYAQQATSTYISNSTGKDIIGGAKANMHSATQNMREAARDVAENLADNLKDSEVKGTSTHRRAKLKHTENKALNELLGENLNIETATSEKLREIAERREEILKTAKQSGQYSEEEYSNLEGFLVNLSDASSEYDTAIQPIYDWLSTYASQFNEQLTTAFGSALPEGMQSAYEAGLKEIAGTGDTPEGMKSAARDLSENLADMYSYNIEGYKSILDKAKQAEEDFMNSDRLQADAEKYNDTFIEQANALDALAAKYSETDAALAASLQSQANSMRNFVDANKLSLNSAVHAFDGYITEARKSKEKFDSAMADGDYYTAINGLKEVYDTIDDKKNDSGKGSLAFWQGAEQILGTETLRDAEYSIDKVKSKLKELKPALNGGEEGTAKFLTMLAKEADGSGKIINEFGEKIATVKEAADGTVSFNIPEENYAAVARQLGVSVDMLTAMIDNARQFANVNFHNIKEVMAALKESDNTINRNGKSFVDRGSLEKETDLHGKQFDNLVKQMESKGAVIFDTSSGIKELRDNLISLGDAEKSADGFTHINLDNTLRDFKDMNMSLEDVEYIIDKLEHGKKIKFDSDTDNISDIYAGLEEANEVESPLESATGAVETLTSAINDLVVAMGGVPELNIDDNFGDITKKIRDYESNISEMNSKEKASATKDIGKAIKEQEKYIADYENTLQNSKLSKEEKIEVQADIDDAKAQLEILRGVMEDLQDGKLDNYTFNADTKQFEEKVGQVNQKLQDIDGETAEAAVEAKVSNTTKLDEFLDRLDIAEGTKETVITAITDYQNGDLDSYNEILNSLPPNVQTVVKALVDEGSIADVVLFNGELFLIPNSKETVLKTKDEASKPAKKAKSLLESIKAAYKTAIIADGSQVSGVVAGVKALLNGLKDKVVNIVTNHSTTGTPSATRKQGGKRVPGQSGNAIGQAKGTPGRRTGSAPIDSKARGGGKKKGGMTLTGELAPELVWLPSQEEAFVVGQFGPEMVNLPADAVVYPGDETRRILAGRSKHKQFDSMATGSATGSYNPRKYYEKVGSGKSKTSTTSKTKTTTSKTSNKDDKAKKTAKDTKEIYDWIEVKLDRIQRKVEKYDKLVNQTNRSYKQRTSYINKEIKKIKEELKLQEKGAKRYEKQMKKVKLPKKWQKLVENGKIDINSVKDEKLNKKIQRYQELYEKFLECKDAAIDLKEQITELRKQKFDLTITKYDGILNGYETKSSMTEERMNQAENRGHFTSKNYYNRLKQIEQVSISKSEKERAELQKQLKEMVKIKGKDFVGSEMWQEMVGEINEVSMAIEESKTKLTEYDKALRELDYEAFDYLLEQISKITEESDFLIDIMSNDKLYDDKGQFTDEGMASMGLHGLNYNVYMKEADEYAAKIKEIQKELEKDPASKEFLDKKNEYIKLQQESISAAEDEKDAIVDMVEEGIRLELESLKELIDSYKDALSSQQDLYNYQRKISDQTKDIASLQKQLSAYANDTSEESKAKIQKLKVSLEDAKQNLKDTEYDHYIDAQKELLDDLYEEYEEILNKRLDNVDRLVSDMIDVTNKNAANIAETIQREAEEVGYTTTETMHNIWKEGGEAHDVIQYYGEQFVTQTSALAGAITSLSLSIDRMHLIANSDANENIKDVHNKVESNQVGDNHPGQVNGGGLISQLGGALGNLGNNSMTSTSKKTETTLMDMDFDKFLKKYKKKYTGDRAAAERNHYKTITGLLKYNDLDPSVSARKAYWKKLGNKGEYKDTAEQNKTLISQFKKRGYARGARSIMKNQIAWTNEGAPETIIRKSDGAILTPLKAGDMVLNPDAHSNIWNMASDPTKFIRDHFDLPVPAATNIKNDNRSSDSYQNDYHIEISLPNVQSYEDFVTAMQHDKKLEKMLQDMTVNQVFGGSSLKKYKY